MNLLSRIKSWFTPRNTAQEIIDAIKARGTIIYTNYGIYVPADPILINGLQHKFVYLCHTTEYAPHVGQYLAFSLVAGIVDPKPETPFVPQLPLL